VRVIFLGDIMTHGQQLKYAKTADGYDFSKQFARVKAHLRKAMVVGNLETTFAGPDKKYAGYPAFNTPDELARVLADLGVHVVTLANNHIFDKGVAGAARTEEILSQAGILWTGLSDNDISSGQPLLVEYGGLKWALVNFAYGSNLPPQGANEKGIALNVISDEAVEASLKEAAALGPDVTVALFHWGNEYQTSPAPSQVKTAKLAAEHGADLVIGTHPHVIQPVTFIGTERGRSLVAYSLGNFISNQRQPPRERTAMLAVEYERLREGGARLLRASVAPLYVSSSCRKAAGCVIQLLYGGPEAAAPEAAAPGASGAAQADKDGEPVQSLFLYDAGQEAAAAGSPDSGTEAPAPAATGASASAGEAAGPGGGAGEGDEPKDGGKGRKGKRKGKSVEGEAASGRDSQGEEGPGLPAGEFERARQAGQAVLEFLGAGGAPDEFGFFTLWDAKEPDALPQGSRKVPY
jgi:poly-gamma-glutamate synthesis protein (capsule biosynthesis protein)